MVCSRKNLHGRHILLLELPPQIRENTLLLFKPPRLWWSDVWDQVLAGWVSSRASLTGLSMAVICLSVMVSLLCASVSHSSLLLRTPITVDLDSPWWPHFTLSLPTFYLQILSHSEILGFRTLTCEFKRDAVPLMTLEVFLKFIETLIYNVVLISAAQQNDADIYANS